MYDIKEIQRLYEKYGSMRRVAREMKISRNTVSKYLKRVNEFRMGKKSKIIYKESASYTRIPQATGVNGKIQIAKKRKIKIHKIVH